MKTIANCLMFLAATLFISCGGSGEKANTTAPEKVATATSGDTYKLNEKSKVAWEGAKPTGKHNGTIDISEGNLTLADNAVTGSFVMDMTSVTTLDLNGENKTKLEDHLKSEDFFDVAKYSTAKFEITSSEALTNDNTATHKIKGNLTMKDVKKNVEFKAIISAKDGKLMATTPAFTIDRTDWKVEYGSLKLFPSLKDKFINDDVTLTINLMGSK